MKHALFSVSFSILCLSVAVGETLNPAQKIDALVSAKLEEQGLQPNARTADDVFLRRAYLDIAGRIPTLEEVEGFNANTYPNKRERLIDSLLNSEAFVSNNYHFWADLLRINGEPDRIVSNAYELWVKDAIRSNMPYDELVYSLITAEGKVWENGAIGYYYRDRGMPLDNMSNTVRIFLGTRLECAQCHDHPFDKWTQMDYFKMAAFTYGINTRGYASKNRSLVEKAMKGNAEQAYLDKAEELTGNRDFPYLRKESMLDRYIEKMPEKGEDGPTMKMRKGKLKEVKRDRKGKRAGMTPHERLGLTKDEFVNIARQCFAAADDQAIGSDVARQLVKELYDPLRYINVARGDKEVKLPHDYQYDDAKPNDVIAPDTMFGADIDLSKGSDRIDAYAAWLTSSENPTFTKVIANRIWKDVFGHGIFEPIDELTDATTVSNPELLAYLEELMRELDYDLRSFRQVLYNTETYQRTAYASEVELGAPFYFQGPVLRRLSAEQIWDSLVALALPEVDLYKPNLEKQLAGIERVKRIYESLEEKSPEDFMTMVRELAPVVAEQREQQEALRAELVEAREADDQEALRDLRRKNGRIKKQMERKIADIAYTHLQEKIDGGELLLAMGVVDVGTDAEMAGEGNMNDLEQTQYVMTDLPGVNRRKLKKQYKKMGDRDERKEQMMEMRNDYAVYNKLVSGMARASEIQSPARPGHFLRDFGQSDREVIENASSHASVPQALNLLNGQMVEALTNPYSAFGKRLKEAATPEEKTRMIFQAMLTREPTEEELDIVSTEVAIEGEDAYEGIVWALLNTQQFLFVQ
ncbi:MAG: hypothetical protein CMO55_06460 [Verrucomicrobiales bacterium]|nr:hypothetical protein [Verrucomicrobiales bacterium]